MARKATVLVRIGVKAVAGTEWGRIAVDKIASAAAGKTLSGAAATNYVSRLFRSNVITGVVTTVVITAPDIYRAAIHRNVSWKQVGKNLVVNGVGVAGGTAGWMGGAALGAAAGTCVLPGVGTAIGAGAGGLIGSMGIGAGSAYLAKKAMDYVVEDDTEALVKVLEAVLPELADEFLMTQAEFDRLLEQVGTECTVPFFREMFAHEERELFVRVNFEPNCEAIIRQRETIVPPTEEQVQTTLDDILASADADEEEAREPTDYVPNFVFVVENFESVATAATSGFRFWPWK
ncbi:hypothetical protein [Burkholderia cenocepacia]|uniref:hypothetical protein n=1 Tax=Burkholderia cenocepacia TaxID=95486 RepID=UPI000A64361E|nr:hypothetical protein [Burkholderia cenocepacia]